MNVTLPGIIGKYVAASNRHDVESVLSCFADKASVQDEGQEFHGKKAIEGWVTETIEKYQFQFKPFAVTSDDAEVVVKIEISGPFEGSPVSPDFHFTITDGKISSLAVTVD